MDKERLKRFAYDAETNQAVFNFLMGYFMDEKSKEVTMLAASFISIDKLKKAWEALELYKVQTEENKKVGNMGL